MVHDDHQYMLDFFREDGKGVGQVTVTPDWTPAVEWVHFEGIRRGWLPAVTVAAPAVVEPLWHATAGRPYVSGFRLGVPSGGSALSHEFPTSYFRPLATRASAALVESGALKSGEVFRYLVSAFPKEVPGLSSASNGDFAVEEVVQPLPLDDAALESFLRSAAPSGVFEPGVDVPVFIPQEVLDEALALAEKAGDVETGGVLVGALHRDRGVPEIFVEVTAQIPAPHTRSDSTKLTFTAETWAAVRAALTLRKRDELMLGWWHSHPDFCRLRNCPVERRRDCTAASPFFSAEDVHLHATCFPCAYQVALLISNNTADGMTWSLFGWRQGMVRARSFHILGGTPAPSVECSGLQDQGPPSLAPDEVRRPINPAEGGKHGTHARYGS